MVVARPLAAVVEAFASGASSLAEVESVTGLDPDIVSAAVDHLVRAGRIEAKLLTVGCPSGGCNGCALAASDGAPACSPQASVPGRRGLVALSLRPVHPVQGRPAE